MKEKRQTESKKQRILVDGFHIIEQRLERKKYMKQGRRKKKPETRYRE